jgi:hypothetical protein
VRHALAPEHHDDDRRAAGQGIPYPNLGITPGAGTLARPHGATAAALFVGCLKAKPRYFPVLDANGTTKK